MRGASGAEEGAKYRTLSLVGRWLWVAFTIMIVGGCFNNYPTLLPIFLSEGSFSGSCSQPLSNSTSTSASTVKVMACDLQLYLTNLLYISGPSVREMSGILVGYIFDKFGRPLLLLLCCITMPLVAGYGMTMSSTSLNWGAQFAIAIICFAGASMGQMGFSLISFSFMKEVEVSNLQGLAKKILVPSFINATTNTIIDFCTFTALILSVIYENTTLGWGAITCIIAIFYALSLIPYTIMEWRRPVSPINVQTYVETPDSETKLSKLQIILIVLMIAMISFINMQTNLYIAVQYEILLWESYGDVAMANDLLEVASIVFPFAFVPNLILIPALRFGTIPVLLFFLISGPVWTGCALTRGVSWLQYITFVIIITARTIVITLAYELTKELFPRKYFGRIALGVFFFAGLFLMLSGITIAGLVIASESFIAVFASLEVGAFISILLFLFARYAHYRSLLVKAIQEEKGAPLD
ncbi:hypothetical protein Pelo_8856 [Pelomyxa schiedti]|nr:hypothetical protein Pelo_8856 [Pelomyxa schiedti]